ncbi:quinon protein alcohol dehydrogenase-like superfamily [Xylaria digitata]|nr:quinon protein alcohol dehydrogenase-like superfamily [Xylaria digitata]
MRAQNPPPGSSSFEPDRPTAEEDVPLQTYPVGSNTNTSPYHLNLHTNHEDHEDLQNSEPTSLPHIHAHTQNNHHSTTEGIGEAEATEGNNDYDMVDAEEGGAPLYDIDMEETNDEVLMLPLQGTPPGQDTASVPTDNAAPQSLIPVIVGPIGPLVVNPPLPGSQQDIDEQDIWEFGGDGFEPHPFFLTNANPGTLMPDNPNSFNFLRLWQWQKSHNQLKEITGIPHNEISITKLERPRVIYEDLKGDEYDLQGINWQALGVHRSSARKCRARTFRNYINKADSDSWDASIPDRLLRRHENYFRFRSMDLRTDVRLLHFQLRNIMGCASRTAVYYPCVSGTVRELDPTTGQVKTAMKFKNNEDASVSTLAAEGGLLVTGSFYGTYRYRSLETENESCYFDGRLTDHFSAITNHVQINSSRRSSVPLAAFASNDSGFRMVDLARNEIIVNKMYKHALNCTALSPDKRLRVMVGDMQDVLITDAETGEIFQELRGHRDFGFACDWAADGWTVATGNQDKSIRIWDARKWTNSKGEGTSVTEMRSEMAGVRSLRFSPLGSGKRLLVAAEEADIINIIDAQTFDSKQTIDVFGELAGVSFTSAGQEVVALSSDPVRGGVLCLERCDHGAESTFGYKERRYSQDYRQLTPGYDWLPTPEEVVNHPQTQVTLTQKRRQAAMAEDWFF